MSKKPSDSPNNIGSTLDGCAWDYTPPQPRRRFFLNPLSSFFGDFPWEGRIHTFRNTPGEISLADPEDDSLPDD